MHPKAATLALHGCGIFRYRYDDGMGDVTRGICIAALPLGARGAEIWINDDAGDAARITSVGNPQCYHPAQWSDVPDCRWDTIGPGTLADFLERL
ncbi:hypothetical protein [Burkholderia sp. BE12]|uniref:hypothetical protein n=1 Tax=Burkholderia sp. BE12 TaxID=2082394 RepID=UPI000CF41EC5|nr:hypothetical protein [Burkholderia sp. BE12]